MSICMRTEPGSRSDSRLRRQRSEVRIPSGAPPCEINGLYRSLATVATAAGDSSRLRGGERDPRQPDARTGRARYIRRSPAIPPELDRPPLFAGVDAMIPDAPGPAEKAELTMIKIDLLAMELRDKLPPLAYAVPARCPHHCALACPRHCPGEAT
jgi:hypothetical protein